MSRYPSEALKQVLLRIPEQMRVRLEAAADENGRSLTAEVLARLASTFPENDGWLERAQKSPSIRKEKQLLALEVRLENHIEETERRLAALEVRKPK